MFPAPKSTGDTGIAMNLGVNTQCWLDIMDTIAPKIPKRDRQFRWEESAAIHNDPHKSKAQKFRETQMGLGEN